MRRFFAMTCILCLFMTACTSKPVDKSSGFGISDDHSSFSGNDLSSDSKSDSLPHNSSAVDTHSSKLSSIAGHPSSSGQVGIKIPNIDFSEFKDTDVDSTHLLPRPNFSAERRLTIGTVSDNIAKNPSFETGELSNWSKETDGASIEVKSGTEIVRSGSKALYMRVTNYREGTYPALTQTVNVNPGDIVYLSVYVRTFNCKGGVGPYTAITYPNATFDSGRWIMNTGVKDWTFSEMKGIVPDGCHKATIKLSFTGTGECAFDDVVIKVIPKVEYTQNTITLKKGAQVSTNMGLGGQGDMFLWNETALQKGVTDSDIAIVKARMLEMKPQHARLFFNYEWWEPVQFLRNMSYDPEFYSFVETVKFYKSIGCEVNITPWGDVFAYSGWQLSPDGNRAPPDDKIIPTAMSLSSLLKYLIVDMKLDNVKYVTVANEPDVTGEFFNTLRYKKLIKALDYCLRQEGIRNRVKIVGSDDSSAPLSGVNEWFTRAVSPDVAKYYDVVASHTYTHYFQTMPLLNDWIDLRRSGIKSAAGKDLPFYIGEFGHGYTPGENEHFEYGLFIAEFANTALSRGTSMMAHWALMDTYYIKSNSMSKWGTFNYKDKGWAAKPVFYAWSLFTSKSAIGDKIYKFNQPQGSKITAVAMENSSGKISIPITNTGNTDMTVTITGLKASGTLKSYTYKEGSLPTNSKCIQAGSSYNITGGTLTLVVPARSLVMLSDR